MKLCLRQVLLALGFAMLVGGWGGLRYADRRMTASFTEGPSRKLYAAGVGCMSLGAGLVGLGLFRRLDDRTENC